MTTFTYSAAKQDGTAVDGEREAENEKILAQALKQEGLVLLKSQEKGARSSLLNFDVNEIISRVRPVGLVEKMFFSRNLSVMLKAGLPLTRALEASGEESQNPKFKRILAAINIDVVRGKSFSDALRPYGNVFNDLYINMVDVGETTGKMSLVLKLLSNQMKKDHDLRSRVKGAMMYPAIIIVALFGIGGMMMVYVIPTLADTIKALGVELPWSTKLIIFISDLFVHYAIFVVLSLTAFIILVWRILKSRVGKFLFDRVILRVPIFGKLAQKFNLARFSRTLAYLLTSGVPFVKSLEITSRVVGNSLYRDATLAASEEIQKGRQLNEIMQAHTNLFHPMVIQMVKVGEETGKIAEMLLRLALFFEEDVNNTTKNLSTIIEPVLMLFIGSMVGFFAISMMQPIYGSLGNL